VRRRRYGPEERDGGRHRGGDDQVGGDGAAGRLVGEAHFVLIGEASHGTHEFYEQRARMARRLIEDKGFGAVAAEADWPDAFRVNRYVRGRSEDATAEEALRGFERFPTWMRRNEVVLDFVGWLRDHDDARRSEQAKAGFYGLDLYSLYRSIHEVVDYLERVDPEAAARARERYACLERSIGVIYRPRSERLSHYFRASLADQLDAVMHVDDTRALEPLERTARWDDGELPRRIRTPSHPDDLSFGTGRIGPTPDDRTE
jgi:erythromycin esterase-like protein